MPSKKSKQEPQYYLFSIEVRPYSPKDDRIDFKSIKQRGMSYYTVNATAPRIIEELKEVIKQLETDPEFGEQAGGMPS